MVKRKRKALGLTRARRPKTGAYSRLLIGLSHEEKVEMELAATKVGLSLSRFIVESTLKATRCILSPSRGDFC